MSVLESFAVGLGLGASLAAPPGPVMAKMALDAAQGRWRAGLLVGLGATSADATYFALVWAGLVTLVPGDRTLGALALAGAALMLWFAVEAWRSARRPLAPPRGRLDGFPAGYLIALTSPFNLAWWVTSGAPFVDAYGPALAWGFFAAILLVVLLSVALFRWGHARIERFETYVAYASAALLAGFAALLAFQAARLLGASAPP